MHRLAGCRLYTMPTDMTRPVAGLPRIGMGCMRLSTAADRDEARAIAVIHAALDAGVRLLDTADAYAHDARDRAQRAPDRARCARGPVTPRHRGGDQGRHDTSGRAWIPDGRARHLATACEASRQALGVERIQLYQLHAPDPRTPLATSVRALEELRRDGLIEAIGLCNVTVGQIEEARAIAPIASIQIELGVWCDDAILGGVVEYCLAHDIRCSRIVRSAGNGGARAERDRVLRDVAARHGATPAEIALAALFDLSADRRRFRAAHGRRRRPRSPVRPPSSSTTMIASGSPNTCRLATRRERPARSAQRTTGEVVLIMGLPGAGKSTLAGRFVEEGYHRLNRDEAGGTLRGLLPALDAHAAKGRRASSSTTPTCRASHGRRSSRPPAGAGWPCDVSISRPRSRTRRSTPSRGCSRGTGGCWTTRRSVGAARGDAGAFAPGAQFRMQRELEPPTVAEGFSQSRPWRSSGASRPAM